MGEAARNDPAGPDELARIVRGFHDALAAGGLGFSTSLSSTHSGADGRPVPSRFAAEDELFAIAEAVGAHPGTTLEMILPGCVAGFQPHEIEFMTTMSRLAARPLNWNTLRLSAFDHEFHLRQLAASEWAAANGGAIYPLTMPHRADQRQRFQGGVGMFSALPGWDELWERDPAEQPAALRDPEVRARLRAGVESASGGGGLLGQFSRLLLSGDTELLVLSAPEVKQFEGRRVDELARDLDRDPFDLLLDIVAADGLQTWISRPYVDDKDPELWPLLSALWHDRWTVFGGSDAGAHVDQMVGCVYTTGLLANGVRGRGLMSLEEAVHQLTDVPARLYGLRERGRIADGWQADLVIFDPETIAPRRESLRTDLPGGASRLYAEAEGIHHVFVNGVETVRDGAFTGDLAGKVLRSGVDTETVPVGRSLQSV
jgi:N-acyl-D-aspartate/D-glutamate deacylase